MCLSTVYKDTKEPASVLMKNVTSIECRDGKVIVTDLMERQLEIAGTLERAELVDGFVIIRSAG